MEDGWIKLYRSIEDHRFYFTNKKRPATEMEAWIDLLLKVNYKQGYWEGMACNRGESLHSLSWYENRWRWNRSRVRRFFASLKVCNEIDTGDARKTTYLKVLNYEKYQGCRHASEHTGDTPASTQVARQRHLLKKEKNIDIHTNVCISSEDIPKKEKTIIIPKLKNMTRTYAVAKLYYKAICQKDLDEQLPDIISSFIARHGKAAKLLGGYTNEQIVEGMNYCSKMNFEAKRKGETWDWTLETVGKRIDHAMSETKKTSAKPGSLEYHLQHNSQKDGNNT